MFEDIGKPNLVGLVAFGLAATLLPKLFSQMPPALGTAAKVVFDLLTESEAEAAEELIDALVSSTVAELNEEFSRAADPGQSRRSAERTVARFKHRARRRAHQWGADDHDRHRRYGRHLTKLREAVDRTKDRHTGWQRDILDDLGDTIEEAS